MTFLNRGKVYIMLFLFTMIHFWTKYIYFVPNKGSIRSEGRIYFPL